MMKRKVRKDLRKLKLTGIWVMLMLFFISELFVYTWCRVQCTGIGYEISKAESQQSELMALRNNLKVELASLKSPARIAKIAKNQLGLTTPAPEQMVIIP
ncbi:MAG: cell division protein FtsL [Proteobacteria bacterium]|nr:cell division protein FtsL [Pseudomonadota bacterium]